MVADRQPPERAARVFGAIGVIAGLAFLLISCEALIPRQSWSRRWGPMVPHTTFPGDCNTCHKPERWDELHEEIVFDHTKETGFALEGAHEDAACLRCHNDRGPVTLYLARGCAGCHVDPHRGTLGSSCDQCHDQTAWDPVGKIADHARTRLPLTGAHAVQDCESCHQQASVGNFLGTPSDCAQCHQRQAQTAFPNHVINGWVQGCERCHTPENWVAVGFNHDQFPLQGGHAALDCTQCHVGGQVVGAPTDCFICHQQDYIAAPDHVAQNFPTDCAQCHNISGFDDVREQQRRALQPQPARRS